jgi:hypothetical protein
MTFGRLIDQLEDDLNCTVTERARNSRGLTAWSIESASNGLSFSMSGRLEWQVSEELFRELTEHLNVFIPR